MRRLRGTTSISYGTTRLIDARCADCPARRRRRRPVGWPADPTVTVFARLVGADHTGSLSPARRTGALRSHLLRADSLSVTMLLVIGTWAPRDLGSIATSIRLETGTPTPGAHLYGVLSPVSSRRWRSRSWPQHRRDVGAIEPRRGHRVPRRHRRTPRSGHWKYSSSARRHRAGLPGHVLLYFVSLHGAQSSAHALDIDPC